MIEVVVPQVGEATGEVTLVRWLKQVGERIEKGEPLFEVDTDKYVVEIEAFEAGTLAEILVPAGGEVMPLQVVATLAPSGKEPREAGPVQPTPPVERGEIATTEPAPRQRASRQQEGGARVLASPRARRLAEELGVELASLAGHGTGPGGIVSAADVEVAAGIAPTASELSRLRRTIAERMTASKREVPHFYLLAEVDMSEADALRRACREHRDLGPVPSVTDLVVAACARALEELPQTNVSYADGRLATRTEAHIGIAVAVEDGLVVPVVRAAAALGLRELAADTAALIERARVGRLLASDTGERSLVVSNLGMYGVDAFVAIIDVPDPMILAVGRVADRCVPIDGAPAIRPTCTVTLSVDHRAFDGALGARFLGAVKRHLEQPRGLLEPGASARPIGS